MVPSKSTRGSSIGLITGGVGGAVFADDPIVETLLNARRAGATLRDAAATAGVHVATVCRWQKRDPAFKAALDGAAREAGFARESKDQPRPRVRWHRDCPVCKTRVVVRTAKGGLRFWRCARWPACAWSSWRPRAPRTCRRCGGACYWSHSRKSTACSACGLRTRRL
jgi:hypothetical protein